MSSQSAFLFFQDTSFINMFLPTLLLPLLGTAVSTSSASFDSWIYDLWMVVLPLTAVPSSELRPETKKLGEMCTSSAPKMVLLCVTFLAWQQWRHLPFQNPPMKLSTFFIIIPERTCASLASATSSYGPRGPRYAAEFPHSAPRTRHWEWIQ